MDIFLLLTLCTAAVQAGCPTGMTDKSLEVGNLDDWTINCFPDIDIISAIVDKDMENSFITFALDTSCEFILSTGAFLLKRINLWTYGASSVRLQVRTGNIATGDIVIDSQNDISTPGPNKTLFIHRNGVFPENGLPNAVSFRLTFSQQPTATILGLRRVFARVCV